MTRFKLLNLNCWLLPPPFSAHNWQRLHKLVGFIDKVKPDIVTLQEVWLSKYVHFLRDRFDNLVVFASEGALFNKTGLVTILKIKPSSLKTKIFNVGMECRIKLFLKKGYQVIGLSLANNKIFFINTHLHDPIVKKEKKITLGQFKLLKRISEKGNFILAGDLNIAEEDFIKINNQHFLYNPQKGFTVSQSNRYRNMRLNRFRNVNQKRDYVLERTGLKNHILLETRIIKSPVISDHYAILANIEV